MNEFFEFLLSLTPAFTLVAILYMIVVAKDRFKKNKAAKELKIKTNTEKNNDL